MKTLASILRSRLEASAQAQAKRPLREAFHFAWIATFLFCFLPLTISLTRDFIYGPGNVMRYKIDDAIKAFESTFSTSAFTFVCIFIFDVFVLGIGLNSPDIRRLILLYGSIGLPLIAFGLVISYYHIFTCSYAWLMSATPVFMAFDYVGLALGMVMFVFAANGWSRHFRAKQAN